MRELCVPSEVEVSLATVRGCSALLFESDIHQILTMDFFIQIPCLIVDRPFDVVGMRDVDKEVGGRTLSSFVRDESDAWERCCKDGVNAVTREVVGNDDEVSGLGVDRVKELLEEVGGVSTSVRRRMIRWSVRGGDSMTTADEMSCNRRVRNAVKSAQLRTELRRNIEYPTSEQSMEFEQMR